MTQEHFRLDEARTAFNSVYSRARLGDMEAIAEIQDASTRYLKEGINFYGKDSRQYQRCFDNVQKALLDIENLATRQASIAGQKVAEMESEIQELEDQLIS